jgi:hypothetical protein
VAPPLLTPKDLAPDPLARLKRNLARCRSRIAAAAARAARAPESVSLVAVTKYVDGDVMRLLHEIGVREFGENRVQDGVAKRAQLADLADARIHLIGHLQRNKVKRALEAFASIHSLDSQRLAEEIERRLEESAVAAGARPPPRLFIEVNVAGEASKTGLPAGALDDLLASIAGLPRVRAALSGLMAMAPFSADPEDARSCFRRLRELRDSAIAGGRLPAGAGLSMGMSSDFEVAIEEGATVVRVGSALYEPP